MDSAVRKLKIQVTREGPLNNNQKLSIVIFFYCLLWMDFFEPKNRSWNRSSFWSVFYLSFRLIEWNDIATRMNWGIVILFGSAISLGIQMKETGAALWIADSLLNYFQTIVNDMTIIRWGFSVVLCSIMTNLLSNAATVAVLGPIVLDMGGDPIIMGMATSVASAFAYLTIVASPTCMIIHSTGLVRSKDFLKQDGNCFFHPSFYYF